MDSNYICYLYWAMLLLCFTPTCCGSNACDGVTVADCLLDTDIVLDVKPFPPRLCQSQCQIYDICLFWRYNGSECYFLNSDYHKDCLSFGGPVSANITKCLYSDIETCDSFLPEECSYEGRIAEWESGPHTISDYLECQEYCLGLIEFNMNVTNFVWDHYTETCQVYNKDQKICTVLGGYEGPPTLNFCLHSEATTVPSTSTTAINIDKCEEVSVGDCDIPENQHIDEILGLDTAEDCQEACRPLESCQFFQFYKEENYSTSKCRLLTNDYRQFCFTSSGSLTTPMSQCRYGNDTLNICDQFIFEDCDLKDRERDLELNPYAIGGILECQKYSRNLAEFDFDVTNFMFKYPEEECRVYSTGERSCRGIGGPKYPYIKECNKELLIL